VRNITDIIEQYLKQILMDNETGIIEIQRSQLAEEFKCVPSQINYVITTRFTLEKGYFVESKRGGGGFIRIRKISAESSHDLLKSILQMIGDQISQSSAEDLIERLYEEGILNHRERELIKVVMSRKVLSFTLPTRDQLRARLLESMLTTILFFEESE
jgi:transcriptional regulator CtsR